MSNYELLHQLFEKLIRIGHDQANESRKLVEHVERTVGQLGYQDQFSVIASELSELQHQARKLALKRASPRKGIQKQTTT